jgi:predicted MFS family arabinose efflux permease
MATGSALLVGPAVCLKTISEEFQLNHAAEGLFLSCPFWGIVAFLPISGGLAERFGFRPTLLAGAVLQASGFLLIAWASNQVVLFSGAVVCGLGRGIISAPVSNIACLVYPERRTTALSIAHAFYHVGVVAFVILSILGFSAGLSWRSIFLTMSAVTFLKGVATFGLEMPKPSSQREASSHRYGVSWNSTFVMFIFACLISSVCEMGPISWVPYIIQEAAGSSQTTASLSLLIVGLAMAIGRLTTSKIVRGWGISRIFWVSGLICSGSLLMAAVSQNATVTICWLALLGFGASALFPTIMGTAGDRFPHAGATMYAVLSAAGALGAGAGPLAIGLIADKAGLKSAMAVLAVVPLLGILLMARFSAESRKVEAAVAPIPDGAE